MTESKPSKEEGENDEQASYCARSRSAHSKGEALVGTSEYINDHKVTEDAITKRLERIAEDVCMVEEKGCYEASRAEKEADGIELAPPEPHNSTPQRLKKKLLCDILRERNSHFLRRSRSADASSRRPRALSSSLPRRSLRATSMEAVSRGGDAIPLSRPKSSDTQGRLHQRLGRRCAASKTDPKQQQRRRVMKKAEYSTLRTARMRLAPDHEVGEIKTAKSRLNRYEHELRSPTVQTATRLALEALESRDGKSRAMQREYIHALHCAHHNNAVEPAQLDGSNGFNDTGKDHSWFVTEEGAVPIHRGGGYDELVRGHFEHYFYSDGLPIRGGKVIARQAMQAPAAVNSLIRPDTWGATKTNRTRSARRGEDGVTSATSRLQQTNARVLSSLATKAGVLL